MKPILPAAAFTALGLTLNGCDQSDLTSITITLHSDGSGAIRANCVILPDANAIEPTADGVNWKHRLQLASTLGEFDAIDALEIAGITFDMPAPAAGVHTLIVTVPRGDTAAWPTTIAPASEKRRADAATAFDDSGKLDTMGRTIKIQVELPGEISATGALPYVRDVETKKKKNTATLLLPVDLPRSEINPITWTIAWQTRAQP